MQNIQRIIYLLFFLPFLSTGQCTYDHWLSCEKAPNPNPGRDSSHWIYYDLGQVYPLAQTRFWNYNDPVDLHAGLREVSIDYSTDGVSWTHWGNIQLPPASGRQDYAGMAGPDLKGTPVRYLLLTAHSNWGGGCYGLSEIQLDIATVTDTKERGAAEGLDLVLAPNPVHDQLQILMRGVSTDPIQLTLFDATGRAVYRQQVSALPHAYVSHTYPVHQLAEGVYTVYMKQGKATLSKRMTKID